MAVRDESTRPPFVTTVSFEIHASTSIASSTPRTKVGLTAAGSVLSVVLFSRCTQATRPERASTQNSPVAPNIVPETLVAGGNPLTGRTSAYSASRRVRRSGDRGARRRRAHRRTRRSSSLRSRCLGRSMPGRRGARSATASNRGCTCRTSARGGGRERSRTAPPRRHARRGISRRDDRRHVRQPGDQLGPPATTSMAAPGSATSTGVRT